MLNKKCNSYFAIIKPLLFIVAAISFLAPLTSNASMRDKWYSDAAKEELQCNITHETPSPDYNSEEWEYGNRKPFFRDTEQQFKRLRKETVGSIEGLIEDKLCDERRVSHNIHRKGSGYSPSNMICFVGAKKSVDNYIEANDYPKLRDKLTEEVVPLCVQFYTEKYFAPTFERLRKEKN